MPPPGRGALWTSCPCGVPYCWYEIVKVRTITGKEAKQTDEDDADSKALRLAFELRYVRKQYAEFQPIDTTKMIVNTFVDTTFDKLEECVIIDKL